jgi:hypothetical protein
MRLVAGSVLIVFALAFPAFGQDKAKTDDKKPAEKKAPEKKPAKKKAEYLNDAAKAMPDIAVQGEYEGAAGDGAKLGLQVVAEGEGRFSGWLFRGGLPGAGADARTRRRVAGVTAEGTAKLVTAQEKSADALTRVQYTISIKGESATLQADEFTAPVALKKVVRKSPTEGAKPPPGAIVLFDGTEATLVEWKNGRLVEGNLLLCGCDSKKTFGDLKMHVEFRVPFCFRSTGRANSGVFPGEFYEIQIMDSFAVAPNPRGDKYETGALYGFAAPSENVSFPALAWQTLDIEFHLPKFDDAGKKTAAARLTVVHNGVKVLDNVEAPAGTNGRPDAKKAVPILLQNHGSPTVFRNVWVVELGK